MIIRYFKSNNASAYVFIPLLAIAIWAFGFIIPAPIPVKHTMPFFELMVSPIASIPWVGTLIGLFLVMIEALLLNYIVNENEILSKQSFLPAFLYVLFMSNNSTMLTLYPLLFANLFLLFAINKLLSSYRKDVAFSQAFDAGFLISIASLFYFPYVLLFPLLGIGLVIMRPFNWREWFISFVGVLIPYMFVVTFYFWFDTLDYLWFDKMLYPIIREKNKFEVSSSFYFTISICCTILLFSFGKLFNSPAGGSQKSKKGITMLVWFFIFSVFSVLIAPEISTKYFAGLIIPASVFSANYFLNLKKGWWGELLSLLLIASIFINLVVYFF